MATKRGDELVAVDSAGDTLSVCVLLCPLCSGHHREHASGHSVSCWGDSGLVPLQWKEAAGR